MYGFGLAKTPTRPGPLAQPGPNPYGFNPAPSRSLLCRNDQLTRAAVDHCGDMQLSITELRLQVQIVELNGTFCFHVLGELCWRV
jgi:hypothetical protein